MMSLIEVSSETSDSGRCYRIWLHPFFQPFVDLLRAHHQTCAPIDTRPDLIIAPKSGIIAAVRHEEHAGFRARAAWFLRLRWNTDETGRMGVNLPLEDVAMLLQTLNDVRLSCWDRMQRPDPVPHLEHFNLHVEGFPKVGKSLICVQELCSVLQNEVARRINGAPQKTA